ncbi:MAG: sodium:solute symporter family transporter [Eubacterium sp.]|jgi:SSS family solute:Na+ symporter
MTFIIVFVVFVAFLIIASMISKGWIKDSSDYILAGREISTTINVFGVIAIGFAGTTITLAPGFTVLYGFWGGIGWGLIYSMCGLLLFGLLYAKFIHRCGAQTLPEFLEMRFDSKTRSVVAITTVVGMCGIMANNIVSSVQSITAYTGWNYTLVMAIIFAVIIAFTYISGMWAISMTDFVQVILGIVVVPMVMILVMKQSGSWDEMVAKWPMGDIVNSGFAGTISKGGLTYPSILNFIICFAAALVWGNNYYWMKIANCRTEKVARNSFVIAAIVLFVVFMIPLSIVGAYFGSYHSDVLVSNGGTVPATGAYGYMASTLTPIFGSLAVIGAVAASVSTSSTSALGASAVLTRDVYLRLINPKADAKKGLRVSKYLMIFVGALTFVLCQFPGGPTMLFAFANCWLVPPAILVGLGAVWKKFNSTGAFWGAICGMVCMAVFTILQLTGIFNIGNYIYLATLGLIVTFVVAVIASFFGKPKYYGESTWERVPTATNRKDIALDDTEKEILRLLSIGHIYMRDYSDYLGLDSKTSGAAVDRLDQGGYLMRESNLGSKMYTFSITDKGKAALPALSEREQKLADAYLTDEYVEMLKAVKQSTQAVRDYTAQKQIPSMRMSAIVTHLAMYGYIVEKGVFRRKLSLTAKGEKAITEFAA